MSMTVHIRGLGKILDKNLRSHRQSAVVLPIQSVVLWIIRNFEKPLGYGSFYK